MTAAPTGGYRLIVVGVSAGGLFALRELVSALPRGFDIPIVVVQHRSKESEALCDLLQECTHLRVGEANDKEPILAGGVYVAPPDYHLLVEPGYFSLSTDEPVRYSRPSIDVMFASAADAYGADVIGVVLTGANADGSRGLQKIVRRGGYAIVQDPADAEVKVMPHSALKAVPGACVLPLKRIAPHLAAIRGRSVPPCRAVTA
ncbi:MAG TPA: chemotaxis protein CheB [Longimicrobium sp.]|nr:chemotaxis protein CheB [Longimicrobium sp.]